MSITGERLDRARHPTVSHFGLGWLLATQARGCMHGPPVCYSACNSPALPKIAGHNTGVVMAEFSAAFNFSGISDIMPFVQPAIGSTVRWDATPFREVLFTAVDSYLVDFVSTVFGAASSCMQVVAAQLDFFKSLGCRVFNARGAPACQALRSVLAGDDGEVHPLSVCDNS